MKTALILVITALLAACVPAPTRSVRITDLAASEEGAWIVLSTSERIGDGAPYNVDLGLYFCPNEDIPRGTSLEVENCRQHSGLRRLLDTLVSAVQEQNRTNNPHGGRRHYGD